MEGAAVAAPFFCPDSWVVSGCYRIQLAMVKKSQ